MCRQSDRVGPRGVDYRLKTETAAPVADRLIELGVPFLYHSSSGSAPSERYPWVTIVDKATPAHEADRGNRDIDKRQGAGWIGSAFAQFLPKDPS